MTLRRAAELLGEDEELLWDMATDMEPEHGCLWIHDTDDQQTVAFTPDGMKYFREILSEYKTQPALPAVLSGRLRCSASSPLWQAPAGPRGVEGKSRQQAIKQLKGVKSR
jgi:hypothetical protein